MRISLFRSTSFGLMLFASVAFMTAGGAALAFVYWSMQSVINGEINRALDRECTDLRPAYDRGGADELRQIIAKRASQSPGATRIYAFQDQDRSLTGNLKAWPSDAPQPGRPADIEVPEIAMRMRVRTFAFGQGVRLLVGRSLAARDYLLLVIERSLFYFVCGDLLLGLTAGIFLAWYASRRLGRINAIADQVREGNLAARATVGGSADEYDVLAQNFNAMLDRIQSLITTVRGVTENIAHDLRTPLNRMRGRLEVALMSSRSLEEYKAVLGRAVAQTDTIVETFNGILKVARIASGAMTLPQEPVDLGAMVQELLDLYCAFAEESGVALRSEPALSVAGAPLFVVRGDAHLISQAAANLLDNAIKYAPPGSSVAVRLSKDSLGKRLTVADNGPGIPEGKHASILERFVRLDGIGGKPGFGLGLSFVMAVADWHGARLLLENNAPGLRATLLFPHRRTQSAR